MAEGDLDRTGIIHLLLKLSNLPVHANNAAAKAAGLVNGDFYRTGDTVKVVHA